MTGIGIALFVGAYSIGLWGYCLVKGYDVNLIDLWTKQPVWPPNTLPPDAIYSAGTQAFGTNPDPNTRTTGSNS